MTSYATAWYPKFAGKVKRRIKRQTRRHTPPTNTGQSACDGAVRLNDGLGLGFTFTDASRWTREVVL